MEKSSGSPHYLAAIEVVVTVAGFLDGLDTTTRSERIERLRLLRDSYGAYRACIESNASYGEGESVLSTNGVDQLRQCIRESRSHVVRQQFAGKHEQDRTDAVAWLERWGDLIATLTVAKQ